MNHSAISSFIWGTADLLRNSFKQHEYGDIILPFTVMRRLDIVLLPTKQKVFEAAQQKLPDALRDAALKQASGYDFYNESKFTRDHYLMMLMISKTTFLTTLLHFLLMYWICLKSSKSTMLLKT